jgi:hypothetical protein
MSTPQIETVVAPVDSDVQQRAQALFEAWKAKELADIEYKQDGEIQKLVAEYFDKMEAEKQPPTKEQIQTLLDQEYVTFAIKVRDRNNQEKTFTIRELPQEAEKVFYGQFKTRIFDKASSVAALAQETMDRTFEDKIKAFLETFEGAFDLIADATVLVLNFDGADAEVTRAWCQANMTSWRMWNIVKAQMEVNRLRDFFSEVSLSGKKTQTMTTPLNVQSLRELLAR